MARARRKQASKRSQGGNLRLWFGTIAVCAGLAGLVWQSGILRTDGQITDPSSQAAFERWLEQDPAREEEYEAFEEYLGARGVDEVVPAWQLARVDREYAEKCNLDVWRLPPRELWPNVVPALRLVRDHVIPAVGAVGVQSSYRTPELNECARGAPRSKHTTFEALDLWLETPRRDLGSLYRDLCAMQERAGRDSRMGLGAYYDPADPDYNPEGRFHIDAGGYRSWGRSYTRATSLCPREP